MHATKSWIPLNCESRPHLSLAATRPSDFSYKKIDRKAV